MYRYDKIIPEFRTIVGFSDGKNFEGTEMPSDLKTSNTGRFYEKEHPMVTLKNLKRIAPKPEEDIIIEYSSGVQYYEGQYIKHDGVIYKVIQDVIDVKPPDSTYYEVYNPLAEYLRKMEEVAIREVLDNFFENKIQKKIGQSFINSGQNYSLPRNKERGTETGFCGVHINMQSKFLYTEINGIEIYLDSPGTFNLYLFKDGQKTSVNSKEVTHNGEGLQKLDAKFELSECIDYYLGYYTSELPENPVRLNYTYNLRYIYNIPFSADYNVIGEFLADENVNWLYSTTLGFHYHAYCDITNFLIEQKEKFANAIVQQFTYNFLKELLYNPEQRVNSTSRTGMEFEKISYDIENITGKKLAMALKSLHIDLSGIDNICFKPAKSIKYKTIG